MNEMHARKGDLLLQYYFGLSFNNCDSVMFPNNHSVNMLFFILFELNFNQVKYVQCLSFIALGSTVCLFPLFL